MTDIIAYIVESEFDIPGDESGPAYATLSRTLYCPDCYCAEEPPFAEPVTWKDRHKLHTDPWGGYGECSVCGQPFTESQTD